MINNINTELKQRKGGVRGESNPSTAVDVFSETAKKTTPTHWVILKKALLIFAITVLLFGVSLLTISSLSGLIWYEAVGTFYKVLVFVSSSGDTVKGMIGNEVLVSFHWNMIENGNKISLGPHKATVYILEPNCSHQRISIGLKGDALLLIPLQQVGPMWSAEFSLPMAGYYKVDARWYGCNNFNKVDSTSYSSMSKRVVFTAVDSTMSIPPVEQSKIPLAPGSWRHVNNLELHTNTVKEIYAWISANMSAATLYNATSSLGESTVIMQDSQVSLAGLSQLSNYEVVCFVGTTTSLLVRENFLSLRPQIASRQRPFKFHHYPMSDLTHPDAAMNQKRLTRKCKQTFVMLDELEISQEEYKTHLIRFLKGIHTCMHDDTWSIWMLTVNSENPRACHSSPRNRTYHHPCNDVLFEVFDSKELPTNVRLMDNTDVSNAQRGENAKDVLAIIAMRIAGLIGIQVDTWRAAGQVALSSGLQRNRVIEDDAATECTLY